MDTVDTMASSEVGIPGRLRVVRILSNGKRRYDPVDKDRLIDAALEPGASIAGLALAYGINANQLQNWIRLRQRRQGLEKASAVVVSVAASAFVEVVEATAVVCPPAPPSLPSQQKLARIRLTALLPNGVRLELEGADIQALSAMIPALGAL